MRSTVEDALGTAAMLAEEAEQVHGIKIGITRTDQSIALNELGSAALCLSGGGIRSASFALGVVQALATHSLCETDAKASGAEHSVLARFHYLSTVSGGGYCGSWLSAWRQRAQDFGEVWRGLTMRPNGPENEPGPIAWLRENSNYLTPKLGLTSADTWAALAIVVRNLILNWLVILPGIILVILVAKLVLAFAGWLAALPRDLRWPSIVLFIAGWLLLIWATRFSTRNRPTRSTVAADQPQVIRQCVFPTVLSAFIVSLAIATPWMYGVLEAVSLRWLISSGAVVGFAVYALGWLGARPKQRSVVDLLLWAMTGLVYGSLVSIGAALYLHAASSPSAEALDAGSSILWPFKLPVVLLLVCGMPWAILSQLIAEMLFVGLSSYEHDSDGDREWFGRAGGWLLGVSAVWLLFMFLVLVGSDLAGEFAPKLKGTILSAGGISGLLTATLGRSSWSPAKGEAKGKKAISANLILSITAPVFAGALIIALSWMLDNLLFGTPLSSAEFMSPQVMLRGLPEFPAGLPILTGGLAAFLVGIVAWKTININRFSLHALYRNRLIRCFLGATNPMREPETAPSDINPFTRFANSDNLRMHQLWPESAHGAAVGTKNWRPFHVINMALNVASTKRLAWQERKAEPFTVTPLHSGSSCKLFRSSRTYGDPAGISVGTAVAISGAAVSPNMGYHSSAPLGFLLAFFNVRLGWWLGNPGVEGARTYRNEGPATAIVPFVREIFGQTTDHYEYVYLSDGGHFENLGIYEMVRRRCRVILVSDAGCDRDYAFEDLGNAVRKIAIDLGISIKFRGLEKLRKRPADGSTVGGGNPRYAAGEIDYPAADGGGAKGILIYIKPSYFGIEGAGIQSYATAHPEFPHESTGNQWFSESQLESYRALGFEITEEVLRSAAAKLGAPTATLEQLFGAL